MERRPDDALPLAHPLVAPLPSCCCSSWLFCLRMQRGASLSLRLSQTAFAL